MAAISTLPPPDLANLLPNRRMPWRVNPALFSRVKQSPERAGAHFKACLLQPTEREWDFVSNFFHFQKPEGLSIRRIFCLHNGGQTTNFENHLVALNNNAINLPRNWPNWNDLDHLRERVLERWQQSVLPYSRGLQLQGRQHNDISQVKVLPVWHATSPQNIEGILNGAFVILGAHGLGNRAVGRADNGFYGTLVYFGTGARYPVRYFRGDGLSVLLAWVSMTTPLPVVEGDREHLEGNGAFGSFDAHVIPIMEETGLPPTQEQDPDCDEVAVWPAQVLPRFRVDMQPDLVLPFTNVPKTKEELLDVLINLLQYQPVVDDVEMTNAFKNKASQLMAQDQEDLTDNDRNFFHTLDYFLTGNGADPREIARQSLIQMCARPTVPATTPTHYTATDTARHLLLVAGGAILGATVYRLFYPPISPAKVEPQPVPPPLPQTPTSPPPSDFFKELFTTKNVAFGLFSLIGGAGMFFALHKLVKPFKMPSGQIFHSEINGGSHNGIQNIYSKQVH